jgi:hypothetical protein
MRTTLVKSALARTISSTVETLRDAFEDTFEGVVRDVGRWAKGTAILYGIGAALALAGLLTLSHGLADLLAAAGLPAFAGHLIVAALAGGSAYALFKAGGRRRISGEEASERAGLQIRIVSPRRSASRSRRRVYDVHRVSRGWEVTGPRARSTSYRSRSRAVSAARRAARSGSGRVVIHAADGRIRRF